MAKNRLVVNHIENSIQLYWQQGQAVPRSAPSVLFEHPFDENALSEIRWYLEQYIRFPYGIEPDKAAKVEQQFQVWGQQLFELVFRSSEEARGYFQEATREGLNHCELTISSDDPVVLNLPWELFYSPLDRSFLAPSLAGMYRSLSSFAVRAEMEGLPQDKLNILLVIARPYGERDIGFKTIARPMLEALKPIRQQVNLKVLRPPSFVELEQELNDHKGFYHIVHFDGHGDFDSSSQGFQHSFGSVGQGVLVFEGIDGSPQIITAAQIAQSLTDCGVPIFVLNACKSAQEGSSSFSSVATRLVSLGAKGVVAMAYNVREEAARHFIGRLYEQLVKGSSLDHAVAEGRKEILNHRLRSSPKGDLPLADWMVPVLYQQITYTPFTPNAEARKLAKLADLMKSAASASDRTAMIDLPEESAYGFVGRDYDILCLERAFRQNCAVLLQGMGGVGKTQLAGGFARWLAETQGRTGGIFFTSFEHGAGLSNVINQIGRALMGEEFSQYPFENQRLGVLEYLKANPSLLIWDNFEPVAGFPAGNEPLLPPEERDSLKRFLKDLHGGESWVLITSRREELWLDCGYTLLNLPGLSQQDAEELAAKILKTAGVDRKKLPQEYLELLQLLGGHPLSLRVVLPFLKTQTPLQLIEALRQGLDTFQQPQEEGRDRSLTVSLDYSFTKLSDRTLQHLPFLALFSERVDVDLLELLSKESDAEFRQTYQAVFGENLQASDWIQILNEAAAVGILEYLGSNTYKIHPALPWYLRQKLVEAHSEKEIKELEKKLLRFYTRWAAYLREELLPTKPQNATFLLRLEEPNLLHNLRFAEQEQDWQQAQFIIQALGDVYERLGRRPEFRSLRQRALKQIGIHLSEAKTKGKECFDFWRYLRGVDAIEAFESGDIETSRLINQEILDELTALNDPSVRRGIAASNVELGTISREKRDFDAAIYYYKKAFDLYEDFGDWKMIAGIYHNLGVIYQEKKDFDKATSYHDKSRKIYEDNGDLYNASSDYFELGLIALQQQKIDLATRQLKKALKIRNDLKDFERAANVYYYLGMIAREQEDFSGATQYLYQALKIREDAKDYYKAAPIYQELGSTSYGERQFDDAIAYYQKAIQIYEGLGQPYQSAHTYYNLGLVAQEQQNFTQAAKYYKEAAKIYQKFQDWHNLGLCLRKCGNALEWQEEFVTALKIYIQAFLTDSHYQPESTKFDIENLGWMFYELGESQFASIWQETIGEECAGDLRTRIREFVVNNDGNIVALAPDITLFMLRIARYLKSQEEKDK